MNFDGNGWAIGSAAMLVVLLVALVAWLVSTRRRALTAEARVEAMKLREKIATAEAVRVQLLDDVDKDDRVIEDLDRQIEENQLTLLTLHQTPEGLTRDQIRARLRKLGY